MTSPFNDGYNEKQIRSNMHNEVKCFLVYILIRQ